MWCVELIIIVEFSFYEFNLCVVVLIYYFFLVLGKILFVNNVFVFVVSFG